MPANVSLPAEAIDMVSRLRPNQTLVAAQDSRRVRCVPHNIACWNWALRGSVDASEVIRPDVFCAYITARQRRQPEALDNGNALELAWLRVRANKTALDAIRDDWEANPESPDVIRNASERLAKLMIEANGFTTTAGGTNYAICTHFGTNPERVYGPNFEHWWIDVRGTCLETFPTLDGYQIYAGHQPLGEDTMYSVHVTGLHPRQYEKIMQLLQLRFWRHDSMVTNCQACRAAFGFTTRRHHCRSCGGIFCSACSNHRRTMADALVRPNGSPERGEVRVCNACYAA